MYSVLFCFGPGFHGDEKKLQYANEDTVNARLSNDIASGFYINFEIDSCKKYGILSLQLANKKVSSDALNRSDAYQLQSKMLKAKALENVGSSLMYENINAAKDSLQLASTLWNETGSKTGMASTYQRLGELYMNQNFENALKYFNKSLIPYEQTGDKQNASDIYYKTALVQRYMFEL